MIDKTVSLLMRDGSYRKGSSGDRGNADWRALLKEIQTEIHSHQEELKVDLINYYALIRMNFLNIIIGCAFPKDPPSWLTDSLSACSLTMDGVNRSMSCRHSFLALCLWMFHLNVCMCNKYIQFSQSLEQGMGTLRSVVTGDFNLPEGTGKWARSSAGVASALNHEPNSSLGFVSQFRWIILSLWYYVLIIIMSQ